MISETFKSTLRLLFWSSMLLIAILLAIYAITANYLGCVSALERLNFEQRPLASDRLLGQFLGSFFGNATLVSFYSGLIALVMSTSLFCIFHIVYRFPIQFEEWMDSRRTQDPNAESKSRVRIITSLLTVVFFLWMLVKAVTWDIWLFRYRSVADMLGIEDPVIATETIPTWEVIKEQYGHLFALQVIDVGAYGYLAFTILGCLVLEVSLLRLSQEFSLLLSPIDKTVISDDYYLDDYDDDAEFVNRDTSLKDGSLDDVPLQTTDISATRETCDIQESPVSKPLASDVRNTETHPPASNKDIPTSMPGICYLKSITGNNKCSIEHEPHNPEPE